MAHKFTHKAEQVTGGIGIQQWMDKYIISDPNFKKGHLLNCVRLDGSKIMKPMNCAAIIIYDSSMTTLDSRSGPKVSNGNIYSAFVDLLDVFPAAFINSKVGILSNLKNPYVIPLCLLNEYTSTQLIMIEAYTEYVAQQHGNIKPDISHIANGMSNIIGRIIYLLSTEIVLNGSVPNKERLFFMLEALHAMSLSAHSAAKYSTTINKIFRLMPYVINSCNVMESIAMMSLMDEVANEETRINQIGLSIERYFKFAKTDKVEPSFITRVPTGIIGMFLSTELATLVSSSLDNHEVINKIIGSINQAILTIKDKFTHDLDMHSMNKLILTCFASTFSAPLVRPESIDKIYDAVVSGSDDICLTMGINTNIPFINQTKLTLNGKQLNNKVKSINDGKFIAVDPDAWAGISLNHGDYEIFGITLGNADFGQGDTLGKIDIANIRITLDDEILGGVFDGISITGMKYSYQTKKYTNIGHLIKLNPNSMFMISSRIDGIHIIQDGIDIMNISNKNNLEVKPLVCFKYCTLNIKCLRETKLVPINVPPPVPITSMQSKTNVVEQHNIDQCLSLTETLKNMNVGGSSRKSTESTTWGNSAAAKLNNNM
jgi:hypothetical protein